MKKGTLFFILLLLTGFVSAQTIQNNDTLGLICRKWKIEKIDSKLLNKMDSLQKETIKKAIVTFTKDGNYISNTGDEVAETGKWQYFPKERRLVCKSLGDGNTSTVIITAISAIELKGQAFSDADPEKYEIIFRAIK